MVSATPELFTKIVAAITMVLLCVCVPAGAQDTSVKILLSGREIPSSPAATYQNGKVFATLPLVTSLGASYEVTSGLNSATVKSPSGKSGELRLTDVGGVSMFEVEKLVGILGGESSWDPVLKILSLTSAVESVELADGVLWVNCSMPCPNTVRRWGDKLVLDIEGAKLTSLVREVLVDNDTIARVRIGQFKDRTVRVVLDLKKDTPYAIESNPNDARIALRVGGAPAVPIPPVPLVDAEAGVESSVVQPPMQGTGAFSVQTIEIREIDASSFDVVLTTSARGAVKIALDLSKPNISAILPNASLDIDQPEVAGSHVSVKHVSISQVPDVTPKVKLSIDLTRTMKASVTVFEDVIVISARPFAGAVGSISDKVIVIDPGHGGKAKGAVAAGVFEKNLNLAIAQEVASELRRAGATVFLTRDDDSAIDLPNRPQVAKDNNASFFLSFHCNSNYVPNSMSGIETYCRENNVDARALADNVHAGVCAATGMCDKRVRTAKFVVLSRLEGSGIPGILLECGYLNTTVDRVRLLDPAYHKLLASGVVNGIKSYISGVPLK